MKGIRFNFNDKKYVWKPNIKTFALLCSTLFIFCLICNTTQVSADTIPNNMLPLRNENIDLSYKTFLGTVSVSALDDSTISDTAETAYGCFPILGINCKDYAAGKLVYLELGDTADDSYASIYITADYSDVIKPGAVAIVNGSLKIPNYSSVSLYRLDV